MRRPTAVALMSFAAASWALATVMIKVTHAELSPLDLLGVEVAAGAAVVWLTALLQRSTFGTADLPHLLAAVATGRGVTRALRAGRRGWRLGRTHRRRRNVAPRPWTRHSNLKEASA